MNREEDRRHRDLLNMAMIQATLNEWWKDKLEGWLKSQRGRINGISKISIDSHANLKKTYYFIEYQLANTFLIIPKGLNYLW